MSRTIAVFGIGPGLGMGVARRFGREGFRVALVGRDTAAGAAYAAELAGRGITAAAFTADVTRDADLRRVIGEIGETFGPIDVALHSAAADMSERSATTLGIDDEALRAPMDLKLHSPIRLARALVPAMLERGAGTVLFSSGMSERHFQPYLANFGVALAAQRAYVRQLAHELHGTGVHVALLNIGALIGGSKAQRTIDAAPELIPDGLELTRVTNDELGEHYWRLYVERDTVELDVGYAPV